MLLKQKYLMLSFILLFSGFTGAIADSSGS